MDKFLTNILINILKKLLNIQNEVDGGVCMLSATFDGLRHPLETTFSQKFKSPKHL